MYIYIYSNNNKVMTGCEIKGKLYIKRSKFWSVIKISCIIILLL